MRHLPLQFSLIWHSYLLLGLCGVFAAQYPSAAVTSALLLLYLDRRLWCPPRLIVAGVVFGACMGWAGWHFYLAKRDMAAPPPWLAVAGTRLCGDIAYVQGIPNERLRVILSHLRPETGGDSLPGLCTWTWDKPFTHPLPGQQLCITRGVKPVSGFANVSGGSYESYYFSQKIYWRMWSKGESGKPMLKGEPAWGSGLRLAWENALLTLLRQRSGGSMDTLSQAQAILPALLFGNRFFLHQDTIDLFAASTLAHSLALSGQHLAIAGYVGWLVAMLCALWRPQIYLWRPRSLIIALASVPAALGYLWLGNAPPSLVRACAMLFVVCIFLWRKIMVTGTDVLCLAALAILLWNPLGAYHLGLQLSLLCVAVIFISWPALSRLRQRESAPLSPLKRCVWGIFDIFTLSFLIQLALLPITIIQFQQAGLWFVANVFWLPVLGFITLPFAFLALLLYIIPLDLFQVLASWAASIATGPCEILLKLLTSLDSHGYLAEPAFLVPHWTSLLAFALLACALAWLWGGGKATAARKPLLMALVLLACGPVQRLWHGWNSPAVLEALDVGQGQAIRVALPHGKQLLVDGGGSYGGIFDPGKRVVSPYLAANRRPYLSAVLNSHPDWDHLGGLFYLMERWPVGAIFHNGREAPGGREERWRDLWQRLSTQTLKAGDVLELGGGFSLEVLHPPQKDRWMGNGASLILRLVHDGQGLALLPGDATAEAQRSLLATGRDLAAKAVVAPHHGSGRDFVPELYESANPEVVIASCGHNNRWNYPAPLLREWLRARGIPLLDTGKSGKITLTFPPAGKLRATCVKGCSPL